MAVDGQAADHEQARAVLEVVVDLRHELREALEREILLLHVGEADAPLLHRGERGLDLGHLFGAQLVDPVGARDDVGALPFGG
jgi:hypothetical protein